jgi:hypothetical protein
MRIAARARMFDDEFVSHTSSCAILDEGCDKL